MLPEISDAVCYRILGLPFDAPNDLIKRTYKKLALQFHPDRHLEGKEIVTEKFVEVSNAYQTILRERRSRNEDYRSVPAPRPSAESGLPPYSPRQTYKNYSSSSSGSSSRHNKSGDSYSSSIDKEALPGSPAFINILPSLPMSPRMGPPPDIRSRTNSPPKYPPTPFPRSQALPSHTLRSEAQNAYPLPPQYRTERPRAAPQDHHGHPNHLPGPLSSPHFKYNDPSFPYPSPSSQDPARKIPSQWIYRLHLTLEELFRGQPCLFQLSRSLRSGRTTQATVDFQIPPGCHHGTRFVCSGVGHERVDGSVQDVVFVVEEERHRRFTRVEDDLLIVLRLPWMEVHKSGGKVCVEGLDGSMHAFHINYAKRPALKGIRTIPGAGMPISQGERVIGRGDLFVWWVSRFAEKFHKFNFTC
ncbi:hypothetical protein HGRIS_004514 [Hohenbuehelia grisea]|uniref:J domain-containing protein n=1 Tax=Hohenbuehelia grisea TaxID=104357 RepID=A0ABR3JC69_9AGAR